MHIWRNININALKIDEQKSVKNYFNEINTFGLKNLINVPTRVNNLGGSLIDRVATQKQCKFSRTFQYFDRFGLTFTFILGTRFEFAFPVKYAFLSTHILISTQFEYAYFDNYAFILHTFIKYAF